VEGLGGRWWGRKTWDGQGGARRGAHHAFSPPTRSPVPISSPRSGMGHPPPPSSPLAADRRLDGAEGSAWSLRATRHARRVRRVGRVPCHRPRRPRRPRRLRLDFLLLSAPDNAVAECACSSRCGCKTGSSRPQCFQGPRCQWSGRRSRQPKVGAMAPVRFTPRLQPDSRRGGGSPPLVSWREPAAEGRGGGARRMG